VYGECVPTPNPVQASADLITELDALKPIEPLTNAELTVMAQKHLSEDLCRWSYVQGITDAERHITGEKP